MPTQNHLTHTDPEKSLDPTVQPNIRQSSHVPVNLRWYLLYLYIFLHAVTKLSPAEYPFTRKKWPPANISNPEQTICWGLQGRPRLVTLALATRWFLRRAANLRTFSLQWWRELYKSNYHLFAFQKSSTILYVKKYYLNNTIKPPLYLCEPVACFKLPVVWYILQRVDPVPSPKVQKGTVSWDLWCTA